MRLTLTSFAPITIPNVIGAGTIFFTPYLSGVIALFTAGVWVQLTSPEVSIVLGGLTIGKNYDVFAFNAAGVVTLELSAAWATDSVRTDALTRQDGVFVKFADPTRLYVGTFRATAAGTTEDSTAKRFLWNRYNSATRALLVQAGSTAWAYAGVIFRAADATGAAANAFEFVVGNASASYLDARVETTIATSTVAILASAVVGIGINSTVASSAQIAPESQVIGTNTIPVACQYKGYPGLGYTKVTWLEVALTDTPQFNFGGPNAFLKSGMSGEISA
jgi:hypothetical protein